MIGTRLAHYEITAHIGSGSMGQVYRAHDTKLRRDVAIKVLPDLFAKDPDRLARFAREAHVLASLNHPNTAAIYGVEERALVMELVEGESPRGPMPFDEAWKIARQIAGALEYAHEKGVIHRDLKPANIKVTPDGVVKLLDFGLAKAFQDDAAGSDSPDNSPTLSIGGTQAGAILGTAAYMAPEQAKGKRVDHRADIWAFGVVFYELLTGERLFKGEDIAETLAAVLREQPDLSRVPAEARRLLRSCLEKDPKKRLQAIGDIRLFLEDAAPPAALPARPGFGMLGIAAGVVTAAAVVVAAALAFIHFRETSPETPAVRSTILPPENTTVDFTQGIGKPAISPDGRRIVFGARTADGKTPLWVRPLDGLAAQPLAGTDGGAFPFWSPDSRFIAFFADGQLKKIDAAGGAVTTLTDAVAGRGGTWNRDGVIVFAPSGVVGPLLRVSSAGGDSSPVSPEPGSFPWFLPDGRHFIYQDQRPEVTAFPIRVGALDGSPSKEVGKGSNALYAQGRLLFLRAGTLVAQPFDIERLETTREAIPVAEQVESGLNGGRMGVFSVSETGLLVFQEGAGAAGTALTWFDRSGKQLTTIGSQASFTGFRFSPDRKSGAATINSRIPATNDISVYDVSRGLQTRFTFDAAQDLHPVWSPNGRNIVFSSNRKGRLDLYQKAVDSVGAEELLYADDLDKSSSDWSADGKWLLYSAIGENSKTGDDLWALPLTQDKPGAGLKPLLVLQTTSGEQNARFSPNGQWIAYTSNESGRAEVYVIPFPPPATGQSGKKQISTEGVNFNGPPHWRQDGREIFYMSPDGRMMAAEVAIKGGTLEVGAVQTVFVPGSIPFFEVSADGQRFLLPALPQQQSARPLTLIQNWAAALDQ